MIVTGYNVQLLRVLKEIKIALNMVDSTILLRRKIITLLIREFLLKMQSVKNLNKYKMNFRYHLVKCVNCYLYKKNK